jgi:RNA polymerase sigma factor (sigma-70 family)
MACAGTSLASEHLDLVPRLTHVVCRQGSVGYLDRADVVQAGYVGLLLAAGRYDATRGPFRRYAANRVIGAMRDAMQVARRSWCAESLDAESDEGSWHELIADRSTRDVAEAAMLALEWQRCEQAMRRLPARSRLVLEAYYWQGWTLREIGMALGVHQSRVKQVHDAAVRGLRMLMA